MASMHLTSLPEWKSARSVVLYSAVGSELSTELIIQNAVDSGKEVYLPVTLDDSGMMTLGKYGSSLTEGRFGIFEPAPLTDIPEIDLIVVPAVAFDRNGHRLGQGKGYYDRFLARIAALSIGFGYASQLADTIPTEPHDHSLDIVVTDQEVIRCGG